MFYKGGNYVNCPNCSREIGEAKTFCPNCGTKIEQTTSSVSTGAPTRAVSSTSSKKKKWLYGIVALLLIGLIGTYVGLSQFVYDQDKQIETIRKAIVEEDADTLASHVRLKGASLDAEATTRFLDGVIDADLDTDISDYLQRAKRSVGADNADLPVRLVEGKKKYGLFQTYELELIAQKLYISSNFGGITVTLPNPYGKEKLDTVDQTVVIKEAFPGNVDVDVLYDGQFGKDEARQTFNSLTYSDEADPFVVTFEGLSVELDQTYDDATLYVNDVMTDKTIGEWKSYGPVPTQGVTLHTYIETDWGEVKSNEVVVKPNAKKVVFHPAVDETTVEFARGIIWQHANEWTNFMYYQDLSQLTVVTDTDYLKRQQKTYNTMQAKNQSWYGELEDVDIVNQKTKIIEWENEPAIETEAVVTIRSQFYIDGEPDTAEALAKSRFTYIIAKQNGEYHLVKATYID